MLAGSESEGVAMTTIDVFEMTANQLQSQADLVKALVLEQLVRDGLVDKASADTWGRRHTLVFTKRRWWRSLLSGNDEAMISDGGHTFRVVYDEGAKGDDKV